MTRFAILLCLALLAACANPGNGPETGGDPATLSDAQRERALYLDLIAGLQKRDLHRAALAHLDEYDRRYGPSETSARRRAEALLAVGENARAEEAFLALVPVAKDGSAYAGLGATYARQSRWREAQAAFEEAVKREPTRPGYLNNLGFAMLRNGDIRGAEFRLRQAEELDQGSDEIRNNLTAVLLAGGRREDAETRLAAVADRGQRDTIRRQAQRIARGEEQ
jgi:Flp pilus assembly protein TadD